MTTTETRRHIRHIRTDTGKGRLLMGVISHARRAIDRGVDERQAWDDAAEACQVMGIFMIEEG